MRTKPLAEQVIVITGATSGIGLATARMAVERGARVVASGRTGEALEQLEHQLDPRGERAACVAGDVANRADVQRIVDTARERFGGFDTWVNNAGVSAYGRLEDLSDEDARRIFETNFWGTVYGSLAAVRHLRQRGGGTISTSAVRSPTARSRSRACTAPRSTPSGPSRTRSAWSSSTTARRSP